MQALPTIVASNVALAAGLAVVVFAVTRLWRNPQFAHALWLVVLIKLVTPPIAWVSLPGDWWAPGTVDSAVEPIGAEPLPDDWPAAGTLAAGVVNEPEVDQAELPMAAEWLAEHTLVPPRPVENQYAPEPLPLAVDPESRSAPSTSAADRPQVARGATGATASLTDEAAISPGRSRPLVPGTGGRAAPGPPRLGALALIAWLAGAAVYVTVLVSRWRQFRRVLAASLEADGELRAEARRLSEALGLRRAPGVRVVDARIPPLVWGSLQRPLVLLPRELLAGLSVAERRSVLVHELAHIRRRDHLVRWLELLVLVPFWWNPVAWWSRRQLRIAEEACCDAWVVWALPESRRSYGQALLRTIEFLTEPRAAAAVAGSPFGGFPFRRRIEMILKRDVSRRMSWAAWVFVGALAVGVLPLAAQTGGEPAAEEPPVVAGADEFVPSAEAESDSITDADADRPATAGSDLPASTTPALSGVALPPPVSLPPAASSTSRAELPPPASAANPSLAPPAGIASSAAAPAAGPAAADEPVTSVREPARAHAPLEARIARLEKLVERLIAERDRGAAESRTPATPDLAPQTAESVPASPAAVAQRLTTQRVAVSPDNKLTAALKAGEHTSFVEIRDAGSGRALALIQLEGRASDLRFVADGRSLRVVIPGQADRSFAVPTGQPLADEPDSAYRELPAAVDFAPAGRSSAWPGRFSAQTLALTRARDAEARAAEARATLTEFLREWTPQRRLLEIDLQQSELKLEAARQKYERMEQLRDSNTVPATELAEHKLAVRQAELDVARVQTQLELHQSKRTALEERLPGSTEAAKRRRDEPLKALPAPREATEPDGEPTPPARQ